MRFEWDAEKARRNLAKHRVSFEEAATAFSDPLSLTTFDPDHSDEEGRFLLLGATHTWRLVVVSHVHRDGSIRIISAKLHPDESGGPMPAARKQKQVSDEMRLEYDFSGGIRGKYVARLARSTNVVVLAPDVAEAFGSSKSVNRALRSQLKPTSKARRPANR
jgi:uncharacterized DUF497 family protein